MILKGFINERASEVDGVHNYSVGISYPIQLKIKHTLSNHAESYRGQIVLSADSSINGSENDLEMYDFTDSPEKADKLAYKNARNVLTKKLKEMGKFNEVEFIDNTTKGKLSLQNKLELK